MRSTKKISNTKQKILFLFLTMALLLITNVLAEDTACKVPICGEDQILTGTGEYDVNTNCERYECGDIIEEEVCCRYTILGEAGLDYTNKLVGKDECNLGRKSQIVDLVECSKPGPVCEVIPSCMKEYVPSYIGKNEQGCKTFTCVKSDLACELPICEEGENPSYLKTDNNGCKVYKCAITGPTCAEPICEKDEDLTYFGIDESGCKILKCSKSEMTCSMPVCVEEERTTFTGKYNKDGCKIFECIEGTTPMPLIKEMEKEVIWVGGATERDCIEYQAGCEKGYERYCLKWNFNCQVKNMTSDKELIIEGERAYLNNTEIKIMPNVASEKAIEQLSIKEEMTIELKFMKKPVYEIEGTKEGKLFGLFKKDMIITTEIDAETGNVILTKKPWWSFIHKGYSQSRLN
ncbi:MAG: hypothetical protein PF542_06295 [Nanoarchaeota archaeon]|jgi:hypothetical protein|nr:hypothetical protein [Nanoarchaeota archaeon]